MAIDADAVFAAEWTLAADGVYERTAARLVIVDAAERVLLMSAADGDRRWWFTIGGGIDRGEHARTAAVREAHEETGLRVEPEALVGPIFRRVPTFTFLGRECRQDELTFFARVPNGATVTTAGWTDLERAAMDGMHWWPLGELQRTDETVYPPDLGDRVAAVLDHGWDSSTPMLSH